MSSKQLGLIGVIVVVILVIGGMAFWQSWLAEKYEPSPSPTEPAEALAELKKGNERYVASKRTMSTDTKHDGERRRETAKGQHPFAAILCCSDSRVGPEFLFDQRPGSLFVLRNAGNLVDDDAIATLDYAVEHLHIPLIAILGHKSCGAVSAVYDAGEKTLPGHFKAFQDRMQGIRPRILETQGKKDAELLNELAKENAKQQALVLQRESEFIKTGLEKGHLRMVYGLCDLETGAVEFVEMK
jgi:carbonic anhydrase